MHRDLKSHNIVMTSELYAKVCDFGLSRTTEDALSTQVTHAAGTIEYMAPEILTEKTYTKVVDVFSFGKETSLSPLSIFLFLSFLFINSYMNTPPLPQQQPHTTL